MTGKDVRPSVKASITSHILIRLQKSEPKSKPNVMSFLSKLNSDSIQLSKSQLNNVKIQLGKHKFSYEKIEYPNYDMINSTPHVFFQ